MSIALVLNQLVSTTLAAIFLPFVSKYGYSTIFFVFAGFTVIYILTNSMFLPETKGKTLEEIEEYFETGRKRGPSVIRETCSQCSRALTAHNTLCIRSMETARP